MVFNFLYKGFSHSALPLLVPIWAPLLVLLLWSTYNLLQASVVVWYIWSIQPWMIDTAYCPIVTLASEHCDVLMMCTLKGFGIGYQKMIGYIAFAVRKKTINSSKMVA